MKLKNSAPQSGNWVVAHSGARDEYQLPISLNEAGLLYRFVTDWYSSFDNKYISKILHKAPVRILPLLKERFRQELPSDLVVDLKIQRMIGHIVGEEFTEMRLNRLIGERAAQLANSNESNLLVTSYYGWSAFPNVSKYSKKVLFQIHPHPMFLRDHYSKHLDTISAYGSLQHEAEMKASDSFLRIWGNESNEADVVIAASTFTRMSLLYAGVTPEKIHVVPYGVDESIFRNDISSPTGKVKILFVGQATQRKGFNHLLKAWSKIANTDAELHIVTSAPSSICNVDLGDSIVLHDRLNIRNLVMLMNESDLLVLPSIAEGYGHVLLQSLSCGTPVLCSDATAGPDLLIDWDQGFIFPNGDIEALKERLEYWLSKKHQLRKIRSDAKQIAAAQTWKKFRLGIREVCNI